MSLNNRDVLVYNGTNWVNSSGSGYTEVALTQPAPATANNGLFNLGDGGFAGGGSNFAGSASGTLLAANAAGGFAGNLADLQVAGASRFSVSNLGIALCARWDTDAIRLERGPRSRPQRRRPGG